MKAKIKTVLGAPSFSSFLTTTILGLYFVSLTACQSWFPVATKTNSGSKGISGGSKSTGRSSDRPDDDYEYEQPANGNSNEVEPQPESPWTGSISTPTSKHIPKVPRIGIIVGPGFLRSFIAAGVLQEFQRAKMPIQSVVGLEWGSLPAALFSLNGQGSEVEWQMLKFSEGELLNRSLLSGRIESVSTSAIQNRLNQMFNGKAFEQTRLHFECLSFDIKQKQYFWMRKGELQRAIPYCLASPPFFNPHLNNISGFDLRVAVDSLKRQGINYIIFINTLASNKDYLGRAIDQQSEIIWALAQNQYMTTLNLVDDVVDTSNITNTIIDFDSRRDMIRAGQSIGAEAAARITRKLKL